jgi:hypothetical protein
MASTSRGMSGGTVTARNTITRCSHDARYDPVLELRAHRGATSESGSRLQQ